MEWITKYANQINTLAGMLMAIMLQYLLTGRRGGVTLTVVFLSSFVLALYVLHPLLTIVGEVDVSVLGVHLHFSTMPGSPFHTGVMVCSSLISAEVISFVVTVLPENLRRRVLEAMGAWDDDA